MLVVIILHGHAEGAGRFLVGALVKVAQAYQPGVALVGHHGDYPLGVLAVQPCRIYFPISGVAFFFNVVRRTDYAHALPPDVLPVTVKQADRLKPAGERALAAVVLQLAATRSTARREYEDEYLVDELDARLAVGIIIVVNRLEERITVQVEILAHCTFVAAQDGLGYTQVIGIYA